MDVILTISDISRLFSYYMPEYRCEASRTPHGSISLQFYSLIGDDVITVPDVEVEHLRNAAAIKAMSVTLIEEFAVAIASRLDFPKRP